MLAFISKLFAPIRILSRHYYTFLVKLKAKEVAGKLVVNNKSKISRQTILGDNVNLNGLRVDGHGLVTIGNNFHSGFDCLFISSYHNYDTGSKIPYDNTYIHKPIIIKDNVWLGSKVIVLGGVTIEEGAIIQAGSVVTSNIPKYAIAGGSPAKVFKTRDIEHYEKLKELKRFH